MKNATIFILSRCGKRCSMVWRKAIAKDDLQQTWKCLHGWSAFDVWILKDVCTKKRRRLSVRKKVSLEKRDDIKQESHQKARKEISF